VKHLYGTAVDEVVGQSIRSLSLDDRDARIIGDLLNLERLAVREVQAVAELSDVEVLGSLWARMVTPEVAPQSGLAGKCSNFSK
jgi:hypothetical protein